MRRKTALISGAGVAGPAAAYWLSAAGWETTIVERAAAPRAGGYVIDFWGLGYDLAERMGLMDDIEAHGYHVRELSVVGDSGQRLAGFGTSVFDELMDGRFVTLARTDLSDLLLDAAAGKDTDVVFGEEIVALRQDRWGVDVEMASGSCGRFDLVVGADGLHSGVRKLAFGPEQQFEKPLGYAVAAFETDAYRPRDPDTYLLHTKPGRMLGRFTLRDDRTLFLFVFAHEGEIPTGMGEQKALVEDRYRGDGWETDRVLERLQDAEELYLDCVSQIDMPTWWNGRIALVGDAAFCVSLLAGQGSALAIVAGYVLAGEIARADGAIGVGLAAYERRLRPYIATKQAGAIRFAGALAPRTRFGLWFRNMVIRSLGIPGVARLSVGHEIIDRLDLPDYAFETSVRPRTCCAAAVTS
jgi:2-polyprenyl-6-methoxyphenol hydroxylase-like FAD-dependent oxidoreductase